MPRELRAKWTSYYDTTMLPCGIKPGSIQYTEMRRAFYAGFLKCLLMLRDDIGDETDEDIAVEAMKLLHDEAVTFFEDVKKGLA